ncbi:MAG: DNA polymerase/3'-5' exonuclease PolX [Chloroflexota bacterium]
MSDSDPTGHPGASANAEVARLFAEIGDILEIRGEPPYRYNAYRAASRSVANASERLETLFEQSRLRQLPGVGSALEAKIIEYLATGRIEYHEQAQRDFPVALASLLTLPGVGPSKARAVYTELGVATLADLEAVARSGRLTNVPGFGHKVVETLLENLERLKGAPRRQLLSDAWVAFAAMRDALGATDERAPFAVVGSVRRMQDGVGGLDVLAGRDSAEDAESLIDGLVSLPNLVEVLERSSDEASVRLYGGLRVRLIIVPRIAWGAALIWYTGSRVHVARLEGLARDRGWRLTPFGIEDEATGKLIERQTEQGVYARLGLPWIAPELREDTGEIEAGVAGQLPKLIELGDIKGDLHTHTNWTDGSESLDAMAAAARARGYLYMALTDHSHNLTVARGLSPQRLAEERALVTRVNAKLAPFEVLLGTEMDILLDGRLDFSDAVLQSLDYVSASVHTGFRQAREVMTERMLRAVSHPLVNTLNHPHGRKIGQREGYAVDMRAVVARAAESGCALELNATPNRLDLNGTWAREGSRSGARFTISSDAHSSTELEFMQFGVGSARRGWLTADQVLNTRSLDELKEFLGTQRR